MEIDPKRMTIGFVGTGTITEAVVTGLGKTGFRDTAIALSPPRFRWDRGVAKGSWSSSYSHSSCRKQTLLKSAFGGYC